MSDNPNKPSNRQAQDEDDADPLLKRFPAVPQLPHNVPEPPKIVVNLPPHPDKPKPGAANAADIRGSALAYQAASSFIMPIIVLALLGWFLDGRFHKNGMITVVFIILGFVVGVTGLLKVLNQMDNPGKKK